MPAEADGTLAESVTDVNDGGVRVSVAVAGSPSSEATVTEVSNGVVLVKLAGRVAGNVTGGRVVPVATG